jgi:hypothetical protein
LFRCQNFVEPQRVLRDKAAAIVADFDGCLPLAVRGLRAHDRRIWGGRCPSSCRKPSDETNDYEAIFLVHNAPVVPFGTV